MRRAQQLGRYHLFDRIAFGGMAEIFRAKTFDAGGTPHWVAVKRVLAHLAEDDDFIQMLVDEAKIASQIKHPNIARVYEFTQAHGEYFIAMEHVDGKDLRTILEDCRKRKAPMSAQHAAYVATEVATALQAAHHALDPHGRPLNIVHRDVSPSNILCAYSGEVKLCDFGIAKANLSRVQTKTGVIKGKIKYMSPEQALGHKVDHRSDIFSLGVCLYEMLTRLPPFNAVNEMDLIIKVREARYRPIRAAAPDVPHELEEICDRCLSKKLSQRYQNAGEVAADLRAFLDRYRPGYSRSQLGRYLRKQFRDEIDAELRQLEEYVLAEHVDDDVGENLIAPALGPEAEYSQFSPHPSQVGDEVNPGASARLSASAESDGFSPAPDLDADEFDIHEADTLILARRQAEMEQADKVRDRRALASTEYAGDKAHDPRALAATEHAEEQGRQPARRYDEALHNAKTMMLDSLGKNKP